MDPLQTLYEARAAARAALPADLRALYGGDLELARPSLYANFVSSLDGVVALDPGSPAYVISGRNEADRFVMGLLRAVADAVIVAAGTMRADRGHRWTPDYIYPAGRESFARLRSTLGKAPEPTLVVITSTGDLDPQEKAFRGPSLVLATPRGAERLRGKLAPPAELEALGASDRIEPHAILEALRARGLSTLLTEGGPHLLTQFVQAGVLDELFLTLSPVLAGREHREAALPRLGLVEGVALDAETFAWAQLRSVKRHGSHLFLRYAFR